MHVCRGGVIRNLTWLMFIALSCCNFFRHIALAGNKTPVHAYASYLGIFNHAYVVCYFYTVIWYLSLSAGLDAFMVFQTI